jgi:hypothetical protein
LDFLDSQIDYTWVDVSKIDGKSIPDRVVDAALARLHSDRNGYYGLSGATGCVLAAIGIMFTFFACIWCTLAIVSHMIGR